MSKYLYLKVHISFDSTSDKRFFLFCQIKKKFFSVIQKAYMLWILSMAVSVR